MAAEWLTPRGRWRIGWRPLARIGARTGSGTRETSYEIGHLSALEGCSEIVSKSGEPHLTAADRPLGRRVLGRAGPTWRDRYPRVYQDRDAGRASGPLKREILPAGPKVEQF